jgi:hypothetical protein
MTYFHFLTDENELINTIVFISIIFNLTNLVEFFRTKVIRATRINDVLRYILQIDKELDENKKGQISKNMSLSRGVEPTGVKSNYFGEDLSVFKTCN